MTNLHRCVLPLFLVLASAACFAQSTNSGDIRGSVTDSSGALIPGVKITVLDIETGVSKEFTTNQDGLYDTSSIVTGSYQLTFTKDGFERLVRGPVTVQVGFTTVNAELVVGAATQSVSVTADVPLLQTETMEQSTTLESKSMSQLPQVTQDWENFMILIPGATGTPGGSQGSSNPGQEVAINGNLPYSNILADGASTTLSHSQNANPAVFETVSELQVNTSAFSAQYGVGGVIFNQITKGGTNQFHGSAYEYFQNDALTAHSPFTTGPIPFLRYNNFGFSIGGPILKNKMFFYFDYDQIVTTATVPLPIAFQPPMFWRETLTPTRRPSSIRPRRPLASILRANRTRSGKALPANILRSETPFPRLCSIKSPPRMQAFYPTPSSHLAGGQFVAPNGVNR